MRQQVRVRNLLACLKDEIYPLVADYRKYVIRNHTMRLVPVLTSVCEVKRGTDVLFFLAPLSLQVVQIASSSEDARRQELQAGCCSWQLEMKELNSKLSSFRKNKLHFKYL